MASITLSMIVKNEEKYLQGCMESARPFVDDIVIVDTGSTDTTVEIAKRYGARIFTFGWTGNFSEARNESLKHATGDWILYMDADERLVDGTQLKNLIRGDRTWAFTVMIRGKHHLPSGIVDQVNAYPRLFRRHSALKFEGVVHEQITPSILRLGKTIGRSSIIIEHLGYGDTAEKIVEKGRRNIDLLTAQLQKHPDDEYAQYQLGNSFVVLKEYDRAEPLLRSVVRSPRLDRSIKSSAYNLLVEIALDKKNVAEAEQHCIESLTYTPVQTMARWFLSGIYAHRSKFRDAVRMIDEIRANTQQTTMLSHDLVLTDQQINEREVYCYEMLTGESMQRSDTNEAYRWIMEAERKNILSIPLQRRGLDIALVRRDIPSAYSKLEYLVSAVPETSVKLREKLKELQGKLHQLAILS